MKIVIFKNCIIGNICQVKNKLTRILYLFNYFLMTRGNKVEENIETFSCLTVWKSHKENLLQIEGATCAVVNRIESQLRKNTT